MVLAAARAARAVRWSAKDLTGFVGSYLTAPKPRVAFAPPGRPLAAAGFARRCRKEGIALDPRSQLLFRGRHFFVNGEAFTAPAGVAPWLEDLAHRRRLEARRAPAPLFALLHRWYLYGWVHPGGGHG
jgi:50S ribosomal protein L16 3-hydroxylase